MFFALLLQPESVNFSLSFLYGTGVAMIWSHIRQCQPRYKASKQRGRNFMSKQSPLIERNLCSTAKMSRLKYVYSTYLRFEECFHVSDFNAHSAIENRFYIVTCAPNAKSDNSVLFCVTVVINVTLALIFRCKKYSVLTS